ncbi:GrpB family protein [Flindersiella endophytica]
MPFPDELVHGVMVVPYRVTWPRDFDRLAEQLDKALGRLALAIDHVGSTSVPGLPAKDCIDVQVRVAKLDEQRIVKAFDKIGFRLRPESWNRIEISGGEECEKLVFAPPVNARPCNVHVRIKNGPNVRHNLLFRDYLRADERSRKAWGDFKSRLAQSVTDIFAYGQIKAPAMEILMSAAETWATHTGWSVDAVQP